MSYEERLVSISLDADASVGIYTGVPGQPGSAVPNSGKQYCFLKLTGKHQVGLAVATADVVTGILQNKPQKPGAACTVGISGVSNVVTGGVVNAGDMVVPDATGRAVTNAAGKWQAQAPSAGAGELIPVLRAV